MIPVANPKAQYHSHRAEINRAIHQVFDSRSYILGKETKAFEDEFASYVGVKYAIGVGSGTEAIHLALKACGIGPGDEVITVSHTAVATVAAIEMAGAIPVLVDIEPDFYTMDPEKLRTALTPAAKAVIPVHLYGQPANLAPILDLAHRYGLQVIEDCSQAHGAMYGGQPVGSHGDMACFSFYPTKNLGALGDGGMVVSKHQDLAQRVRLLREYGWAERYISHFPGWNSRLDEIQASILRIKLKHLDRGNKRRMRIADIYMEKLNRCKLALPVVREDSTHVYHLFVVRTSQRDALQNYLQTQGIGTSIHYPVPVHLQPAYRDRLPFSGNLPVTEHISREILSLPMYPELSESETGKVIEAITNAAINI